MSSSNIVTPRRTSKQEEEDFLHLDYWVEMCTWSKRLIVWWWWWCSSLFSIRVLWSINQTIEIKIAFDVNKNWHRMSLGEKNRFLYSWIDKKNYIMSFPVEVCHLLSVSHSDKLWVARERKRKKRKESIHSNNDLINLSTSRFLFSSFSLSLHDNYDPFSCSISSELVR